MNTLVLLGTFFILIIFKVPVAISLAMSSFIGLFVLKLAPLTMIGQAAFDTLCSYTAVAIPFYIFAGVLMTRGGISKKLCDLARCFVGRFTGGIGMVTVWASAFFAAISGSSTATTASIGSMMVPEMKKSGYDESYGLAIAAAGGVIGPIIPPSVSFVLYGVSTETSIGDLFLAGILPGLLMTIFLCLAVYITAKKKGYKGDYQKFSIIDFIKKFIIALWNAKWAILVPFIILGGIYGGIFTPTEAGAVACVYAMIITLFVERSLTFKELMDVLREAAVTSSTIFLLVATGGIFGRVLTIAEVPQQLAEGILSIAHSKFIMLLLVNMLLFVVGCVMDCTASIIILGPLLLPIATAFGVNPIHFGIIFCMNIGIGVITPPVGACLFTASVISDTPFEKICRSIVPFLLAELATLFIVVCFEPISTILVDIFS